MNTQKSFAADEESVLMAFSMEPAMAGRHLNATSLSTRSMRPH